MPPTVRLALVQHSAGPDVDENVERGVAAFTCAAEEGARLVVFPELAFTGFHPQEPATGDVRCLAEPIPGPTTDRFRSLCRETGVACVLNLFERTADGTYDASPVIDGTGELLGVTRMAHVLEAPCCHEKGYYRPSPDDPTVYDLGFCRLGVAICYDRHFPEYMRALALAGASLVVIPQAGTVGEWPEGLFEAEVQVAAFHHGYFVALANRVGREAKVEFAGQSFVAAPDGRVVARAPAAVNTTLFADVDLGEVERSDARRYFLQDRRPADYSRWLGWNE